MLVLPCRRVLRESHCQERVSPCLAVFLKVEIFRVKRRRVIVIIIIIKRVALCREILIAPEKEEEEEMVGPELRVEEEGLAAGHAECSSPKINQLRSPPGLRSTDL